MKQRTLENRINRIKDAPAPPPSKPAPITTPRKEKRFNGRQVTYKFSSLITSDGRVLACIVTNMSEQGMKVVMKTRANLTPEVTISIPELGTKTQMRVVWQNEDEVGMCQVN